MALWTFFPYIFILFGVVKVVAACTVLFMPPAVKARLAKNKYIAKVLHNDTTLAGRIIELALLIFGVYSILHGLSLLGFLHTHVRRAILHPVTSHAVYAVLGIGMTFIYSAVVFHVPPVDIPHDPQYMSAYETLGVGGGTSFLMLLSLSLILHALNTAHRPLDSSARTTIALLAVFGAAMALVTVMAVVDAAKRDGTSYDDLTTLAMVHLQSLF